MATTLQAMACAPRDLSLVILEDLRERPGRYMPDQQDSQDSTSGNPSPEQDRTEQYVPSESISPSRTLPVIAQIFSPSDLPPEHEVREAAAAFASNTAALFYVISTSELEELRDKAYRPGAPVDVLSLCEICTLAAAGYQCLPEGCRFNTKQSLCLTATVHLRQCLESDKLRTIRIIICIICYEISENKEAARLAIGNIQS